jgi:hypothetical protein
VTPTTTWAFKGPDGTAGTFYTVSDSPISDAHANDRFIRYRAYLSTQTATVTPNVSDVSVTYTSDCVPPGQVIFSGLGSGQYSMSVSKPGYAAYVADVTMSANWVERQVILGP